MRVTMKHNYLIPVTGISFLLFLGGCSINGADKILQPQKTKSVDVPSRAVINTRPIVSVPKVPSNNTAARTVKPYKPQIKRYREPKPVVRILTAEEQAAFKEAMIQVEKKRREVDDPYASIPDNSSSSKQVEIQKPTLPTKTDSSAVDSLMLQARAEMMVGKYLTAESKIERGLRIDPENSKLWALLAKTHYAKANYSQSISMARKAIQFSRDDDLTARNWRLIKKAGKKSGDTFAIKEADNYIKMNP